MSDMSRTLTVKITGETSGMRKSFSQAYRDADGFGKKMAVVGTQMKSMVGPALLGAGVAAGAFAVKLGVDAVQGAIAEQQELATLQKALDNVGQGFKMPEVDAFISKLQMATGVSDSDLRPAFQTLVTATGDVAKSMDLMNLAMDISAGTGKDLSTVTAALGKAANGSFTSIGKLTNGAISPAILATKNLDQVTAALSSKFGGAAAAAANTWAGRIARVQQAIGELSDSFGTGFLSAFEDAGGSVESLMTQLQDLQPVMETAGKSIGDYLETVMNGVTAVKGATDAIDSLKKSFGPLNDVLDMTKASSDSFVDIMLQMVGLGSFSSVIDQVTKGLGLYANTTAAATTTAEDNRLEMVRSQLAFEASGKAALLLRDGITESSKALEASASPRNEYLTWSQQVETAQSNAAAAAERLAGALEEVQGVVSQIRAMQKYKDSIKSFVEEPTKDAALTMVESMLSAADSIDDPTRRADFLRNAIDKVKQTAADEGIRLPRALRDSLADAADEANAVTAPAIDNIKSKLEGIQSKDIYIHISSNWSSMDPAEQAALLRSATGGPVYATGGMVRAATGTHASDSIMAMLSRGEYVLNADTVKRVGVGALNNLNNGGAMRGNGVTIEQLVVESAPGERAEESVPRALRRFAFVAGLNG